jgi:hypothetical protein
MLLLEFVFFLIFYLGLRSKRKKTLFIVLDRKSMSRNLAANNRRRDDLDEYWFEKIAVTTKVWKFD